MLVFSCSMASRFLTIFHRVSDASLNVAPYLFNDRSCSRTVGLVSVSWRSQGIAECRQKLRVWNESLSARLICCGFVIVLFLSEDLFC